MTASPRSWAPSTTTSCAPRNDDPDLIVVLSGESGSGKTTICTRVVTLARARGLEVAGVLTPPRLAGGRKVGLDVEDIRTGQRRPLAEPYAEPCPESSGREPSARGRSQRACRSNAGAIEGPATESWHFHMDGLTWGTKVLRHATPCDLLVIDELGPLELIQGQGWTVSLELLRAGRYRLALVVVRPALLPYFRKQLGGVESLTLTVTGANRNVLPEEILALLEL